MSTPTRRPSSKAAMLRKQDELTHAAQHVRQLPAPLARVVDTFDVSRYGTCSQPVRPFLREVITRSTLSGTESVRKHCRHLTALAVYSDRAGLPLQITAVLTTTNIDSYITAGMIGESDANRAERRRRLLSIATAVNPGPQTPSKLSPIAHRPIRPPYTPQERATILRATRTQPTERLGQQVKAVVALGFGAGADTVDLRELWVRDIVDHGERGVSVTFHGPRPRVVWVRACVEDLLRTAIAGRDRDELVIGRKLERRNTGARVLEQATWYKVPDVDQARMRATWLADLMTDPIPLAVILKAAGLLSARSLVDVMAHVGPWRQLKNLPQVEGDAVRGGDR